MSNNIKLDPKSQLLLLITVSGILIQCKMSGPRIVLNIVLLCIPILFLLKDGKYWKAIRNAVLFSGGVLCQLFVLPNISGVSAILASFVIAMFVKIMPGIVLGFYMMSTIEASKLIASMECMKFPRTLTWTISLIFRFFPTVAEEFSAIRDCVRIRGVRRRDLILHPIETVECIFVPLILSVVNIGDELLTATLTKGFSMHGDRSSIEVSEFKAIDYITCAFAVSAWILNYIL